MLLKSYLLAVLAISCYGNRLENEVNKKKLYEDRLFQLVTSLRGQVAALQAEVSYIRRKTKHTYEILKDMEWSPGGNCSKAGGSSQDQSAIVVDGASQKCPLEFPLRRRNSCYYVRSRKVTWLKARAECGKLNGYLVAIETEGEHKFLMNQIHLDQNIQHCDFWTGGTDVQTEGHWVWNHTGDPLAFTNWHTLEPNNGSGDEHCLWLDWYFNWKWNDATCNRQRACFICETQKV